MLKGQDTIHKIGPIELCEGTTDYFGYDKIVLSDNGWLVMQPHYAMAQASFDEVAHSRIMMTYSDMYPITILGEGQMKVPPSITALEPFSLFYKAIICKMMQSLFSIPSDNFSTICPIFYFNLNEVQSQVM